jgi:predicted Zn-dependent protease
LAKLKAYEHLLRLACDPAADIEVRTQAAQVLEDKLERERAVQAWSVLAKTAPRPIRRLQATQRLARLDKPDQARLTLHKLLKTGDLPSKFQIEAVKTLGTIGEADWAKKTLSDVLHDTRDRSLRLRCAEALCALGQTAEAAPALQALAADYRARLSLRQATIYVLCKYRHTRTH